MPAALHTSVTTEANKNHSATDIQNYFRTSVRRNDAEGRYPAWTILS
jgi:hypothetical protein